MQGADKHFLETPSSLVIDSLQGLCLLNPNVKLDITNKVILQRSLNRAKVALVCGGGSGHEPAHAAFVGDGMLTAAVCGNIFSSPSASQVRRAIDLVDNDNGTIIIVKNYTGDVLNFGLAKENYAASHPDKIDKLRFVTVGDDVSVGKTQGSIVGRRGLVGTVLVYKIAGALANQGAGLDEVYKIAQWVAQNVGTIGVGMEHCHVPGTEAQNSHLSKDEIEIGMGIHNEPGHTRLSPIPPLHSLVSHLVELVTNTTDPERSFVSFHHDGFDEVVLLVNNLGGLSELELGGITKAVGVVLSEKKIKIRRVLAGNFMTSLNMPGFSLTLLLLPRSSYKGAPEVSLLLSLLDDGTNAPGWKWSSKLPPTASSDSVDEQTPHLAKTAKPHIKVAPSNSQAFLAALARACRALAAAEPEITHMDSIAGDGDCGLTLKAGADAILQELESVKLPGDDIVEVALAIARAAEERMGGTSGALYSIFFSSLAQGLLAATTSTDQPASATAQIWSAALDRALKQLYTYTRARPPSRTLVDPLDAFVQTLISTGKVGKAVEAAARAAEETRNLEAKAGRSAYVEGELLRTKQVPDPGAWGVKVILESLFATA